MPGTDAAAPSGRPTLGAQLAAQHELLIALATKSGRQGSQSATLTERTTGAENGLLAVKVELVQREDEGDAAFLGRLETFGRRALDIRDALNAHQAEQRQAVEAGGDE